MAKIFEIVPIYCETIPRLLEEGKLYISEKYGTAVHLCACGCGTKSVTPLSPYWQNEWTLHKNRDLVTLRPSIGNFNGEDPYHAHYHITNNKIDWR